MKIVPIKKIFKIIDSCTNFQQLETCKKVSNLYTKQASSQGVINTELVKEVLFIKINEKKEELKLTNKFKGSIRRKKIKFTEPEYEFIEKF